MTQTPNFQLNQWSGDDYVRRTDFNADNAKIDAAIKALTTKSAVVTGTYTGTGAAHTLELGFRPSLFIVWGLMVDQSRSDDSMGNICFDGGKSLSIRRSGNYIANNPVTFTDTGISLGTAWPNQESGAYFYAAFR